MGKVKMSEDKLTLYRERDKSKEGVKPVFIHTDYHERLKELKAETNIPLGELIEIFIDFAVPRLEIEGDK
jgi:transcription initiation factor IIE alpha subunit